jgi:peptidoglycan-N-acetylglucosamine deacetylase
VPRPFIVTTSWDDGHPLDFKIAEMLSRFGIPGTFYVPMESEFGVMSRGEILELSKAFEVGAHTLHHVYLNTVSQEEARREIVGSKQAIEDICGQGCRVFCFPGGKFSTKDLDTVKGAGYSAARTVEMMSIERPEMRAGLAIMPTTLQVHSHSRGAYAKNVAKRLRFGSLIPLSLAFRAGDLESIARALLDHAAAQGGVFHLWGHSWEIEASQEWETLESLLKLIASYKPSATMLTNGALADYAG